MKKYTLFVILCILMTGLFLLTGCPAPQEEAQEEEPAAPVHLAIGGGPSGGSFAAFAAALSQVINEDLPELVNLTATGTTGTGENIALVSAGDIEMGLADGMSLYYAFSGIEPSEPLENLRAVGLIVFASLHIVTREGTGIETIEDLADRIVATGSVGSSTEQNFMTVTDFVGIWDKIGRREPLLGTEAITALKDGHVEAFTWSAPHPHGPIADLATTHEIKILDSRTLAQAAGFFDEYPFFWEGVIPAGTYGIPADVPVMLSGLYIFTHKDLDEDLVYEMTRLLYESTEKLTGIHASLRFTTLDNALTGLAIPLHAGAQRYFEEAGLQIPEAIQAR